MVSLCLRLPTLNQGCPGLAGLNVSLRAACRHLSQMPGRDLLDTRSRGLRFAHKSVSELTFVSVLKASFGVIMHLEDCVSFK
ncbi:hypothetical protein M7I_8301 [Glarea lozoyensis 74030]|uniref:Uncharacterized protein n=1 Tax=Glarea lozoyensis (strain ATCC 74030 / MF5533) TaxID=1104152 RepID=H0EZM5_GLAL7|nr:hypothetical protein M7I_8301 [Glarea lozoyensis 74030]